MTKALFVVALSGLLFGCDEHGVPNTSEDCREFAYKTVHPGVGPVTCEVLWCNRGGGEYHQGSGMAVLWCDGPAPAGVK